MVLSYADSISQEVLAEVFGFFLGCILGWLGKDTCTSINGKRALKIAYVLGLFLCMIMILSNKDGLITCPVAEGKAELSAMMHRQTISLAFLGLFFGSNVGWLLNPKSLPFEVLPKYDHSSSSTSLECYHICYVLFIVIIYILFCCKAALCTRKQNFKF